MRERVIALTAGRGVDLAVDGVGLRSGHMASLAEWHAALRFVANTRFKPVVDRVFGLADRAEAYRYLEQQEQFGKVVIRIS